MSKFTASKSPLFRSMRRAPAQPSWPVGGSGVFPMPSKKDPITENIVLNMRQRSLLKLQSEFGLRSAIHVEAPRNDRLFKIRRVEK
jgi:hypothetical protein